MPTIKQALNPVVEKEDDLSVEIAKQNKLAWLQHEVTEDLVSYLVSQENVELDRMLAKGCSIHKTDDVYDVVKHVNKLATIREILRYVKSGKSV